MKNFKFLALALLATVTVMFSSCLHIIEEVTIKNNGSGSYKMTMDMSELKGMMDMLSSMKPDSAATDSSASGMGDIGGGGQMAEMGKQLTSVAESLKGVKGISTVAEILDTASYQFGYSFDFENADALNRALKIIGKEKFDSKNEKVFEIDGKKFKRLSTGDFGAELKKQMSESGDEGDESQMEMVKMFFADMTYKQIYHFERKVKKSSNELSEISEDGQTVTITIKPFDEEMAKKNPSVATEIKLK